MGDIARYFLPDVLYWLEIGISNSPFLSSIVTVSFAHFIKNLYRVSQLISHQRSSFKGISSREGGGTQRAEELQLVPHCGLSVWGSEKDERELT